MILFKPKGFPDRSRAKSLRVKALMTLKLTVILVLFLHTQATAKSNAYANLEKEEASDIAQPTVEINGQVLDQQGQPLQNATVVILGTKKALRQTVRGVSH